jgi:hypothetical protein
MSPIRNHASLVALRRLLRRLDRAHTSEESSCPACRLQRLALQLNEEVESEASQIAAPDLLPGAASVGMAIESVLTVIYTLDVRAADEQGRVVQALLDYIGEVVMDQLAHDEQGAPGEPGPDEEPPAPEGFPPQRRGSLH